MKNLFFANSDGSVSRGALVLNLIFVFLIFDFLSYFVFSQSMYQFNWDSVYEYRAKFIEGFFTTVVISFFALFLSLAIGFLIAFGQRSLFLPIRFFSRFYVELIRGTPLLVQILLFFYIFANAFGFDDRYVAGVVILSIFSGAYMAEILRGAIESIGKDQHEAAFALHLNTIQKYRYIIIPQAIKRAIPAIAGQFASIIKDSSLLSIISIREFTMNAQEVNAFTYSTIESYIPLAIGYLALTYPISWYSKSLEKKFSY